LLLVAHQPEHRRRGPLRQQQQSHQAPIRPGQFQQVHPARLRAHWRHRGPFGGCFRLRLLQCLGRQGRDRGHQQQHLHAEPNLQLKRIYRFDGLSLDHGLDPKPGPTDFGGRERGELYLYPPCPKHHEFRGGRYRGSNGHADDHPDAGGFLHLAGQRGWAGLYRHPGQPLGGG
jgi:hypothetical protein